MSPTRHFLGWDEPATVKVRRFLLAGRSAGPFDLDDCLVVVPTRQAGRRLREHLAEYCGRQGSALLSLRAITPAVLAQPEPGAREIAGATALRAVWADLLINAPPDRYRDALPGATRRHYGWAVQTADLLQNLRNALADGGLSAGDVPAAAGEILEEPARWQALIRLESDLLQRLEALDLDDPCRARVRQAGAPRLPEGVARVVVAAVPDPTPLMLRALDNLPRSIAVDVLVCAPPDMADAFDAWGRPLPEAWETLRIEPLDPDRNVLLEGSPADQSRRVVEEIAADGPGLGPADLAIGVPDRAVIPFLEAELRARNLPAFDPAEKRFADHPLGQLTGALCSLLTDGSFAAMAAFLRHPDVLDALDRAHEAEPQDVLSELDDFRSKHLPLTAEAAVARLLEEPAGRSARPFPCLARAAEFVRRWTGALASGPLPGAVREFLGSVYEGRSLSSRRPGDREFGEAAAVLETALRELDGPWRRSVRLANSEAAQLLARRLAEADYPRDREGAAIDLEGWLELPWSDAPFLYVTGMNEGIVPDSRLADAFLPDALRERLGLRPDRSRLARDAFLMRAAIESRRGSGRACFIAGKTSAEGDPLKPSRLLFRCPDAELPGRAARLFGPVRAGREVHPPGIGFKLRPSLAARSARPDRRLRVTAFRTYLACPFRFYLKHVLGMEPVDPEKAGPDALDFGTLIHHVFERLGGDARAGRSGDERQIAACLERELDRWIEARYGQAPALPVLIAADSARQRLRAAAREQARQVDAGWEVAACEQTLELVVGGWTLRGTIDRIDRNARTGEFRLVDYKTSDAPETPAGAHLAAARDSTPGYALAPAGDKPLRWVDLQLPLYRLLAGAAGRVEGTCRLAYFNLPRAVGRTAVEEWDGFDDGLLDSARRCAEAVVERIDRGEFWPPAPRMDPDDFEALWFGRVEDCFEPPGGAP